MNSNIARRIVENELLEMEQPIDGLFNVSHTYVLGSTKDVFGSIDVPGVIWEVTYNSMKNEYYVDRYVKKSNTCYRLNDKERSTSLNCMNWS